jgi:hypothetical protein
MEDRFGLASKILVTYEMAWAFSKNLESSYSNSVNTLKFLMRKVAAALLEVIRSYALGIARR